MATLNKAVWMWRQVKRAISVCLLGGGIYLLWLLYIGDINGLVLMFFAGLLIAGGFVGMLFPSKLNFFEGSGDDAY